MCVKQEVNLGSNPSQNYQFVECQQWNCEMKLKQIEANQIKEVEMKLNQIEASQIKQEFVVRLFGLVISII